MLRPVPSRDAAARLGEDLLRIRPTDHELHEVLDLRGQLLASLPHLLAEAMNLRADDLAQPFFTGLLPEGNFLRIVARAYGVSAANSFKLLEDIGGECAGAISLVTPGADRLPAWEQRTLDAPSLFRLIDELPSRPLLVADGEGLRLSLAGAQDKLPVFTGEHGISITGGNPPSTDIIKIPDARFPGLVTNEAFCLSLARSVGLDAAEASPQVTYPGDTHAGDPKEFLLVKRYDRWRDETGIPHRIHQEDLCQATGIAPGSKYEAEGGPGLEKCCALLERECAVPAVDRLRFVDGVIFNFLIGNHDAHAKNWSLLLEGPDTPRLAPMYDLVSTAVYPGLDRKMAMKIGGEYRPEWIRSRHLERMASEAGMSAGGLRDRAGALVERVGKTAPQLRAQQAARNSDSTLDAIAAVIEERSQILRDALAEM